MSEKKSFKGKIRKGAVVGQDFQFVSFYDYYGDQHLNTEFDFELFSEGLYRGRAKGFGLHGTERGDYGNGAVYVNEADIVGDVPNRFEGAFI